MADEGIILENVDSWGRDLPAFRNLQHKLVSYANNPNNPQSRFADNRLWLELSSEVLHGSSGAPLLAVQCTPVSGSGSLSQESPGHSDLLYSGETLPQQVKSFTVVGSSATDRREFEPFDYSGRSRSTFFRSPFRIISLTCWASVPRRWASSSCCFPER